MIPPIDYRRHVVLFGTTGSGKTTTLRTLIASAGVSAVLFDLKGEMDDWPAIHHDGLQVALYDLDWVKLLRPTAAGEDTLRLIARDRGIVATIPRLIEEIAESGCPHGTRAALTRAARRWEHCRWIAEPTIDLGDVFAGGVHVVRTDDYVSQADWLLSTLRRATESPGLRGIICFEEAHLLADLDLPTAAKMLRSKGFGIVFVTQSPRDLPAGVLDQCNTRIFHRLLPGRYAERIAPPGVDRLGVGECIIDERKYRITPADLPPVQPWPRRGVFQRA